MLDFPLITESEFESLPQKSLIFGVNNRLLHKLSERYAANQSKKNLKTWTNLRLELPSTWLNQLIEQSQLGILDLPIHKTTLTPESIHYLWTKIITNDNTLESNLPLIDTENLAQTAMEAYQLELEWSLPQQTFFTSEEQAHYQKWRIKFNKLCTDHNWSTPILQEIELIHHLSCNPKAYPLWPTTIIWAGFERLSTHLETLQGLFEQLSIPQFQLTLPHHTSYIVRHQFKTTREEHHTVAHWAAQSHKDGKKVAWITPNLSQERDCIIDALDQATRPEYYRLDTQSVKPALYNISLGKPLANYSIIQIALTLLDLASTRHPINRNHIITLLLSPFWSLQRTEQTERSVFIDFLRNNFSPISPIESYQHYLTVHSGKQYLSDLKNLFQNNIRHHKEAHPSYWASLAKNTLITTGWLTQPLNSEHYQTVQKFIQALDEIALMDVLNHKLSPQEWLGYLRRQCQRIIFQAEQTSSVTIEVLGLLEAVGGEFDEIWISGLSDRSIPSPPKPNPLLPLILQKDLPHSSHEVEWAFANQTFQTLIKLAPIVHCSHSINLEGRSCLPSPLIANYLLSDETVHFHSLISCPQRPTVLETILEKAPPLTASETTKKYSTKLLQLQNQSGLLTFFTERLKATPLLARTEHFNAADHGQILHQTLEQYYLSQQDHSQTYHSSNQRLSEAIHKTLTKYYKRRSYWTFPEHVKTWEFARIRTWLESWLSFEEQTLLHHNRITQYIEYPIELSLGSLLFTGRVDRIDCLKKPNGLLLIDYKSSLQTQLNNWYQNPAANPQMPFYALALFDHLAPPLLGLTYGILKPSQHKWQGISPQADLCTSPLALNPLKIPEGTSHSDANTAPPQWGTVLDFWKKVFEETVHQFIQGNITVDLKQFTEINDPEYLLLRLPEKKQYANNVTD